MKLPVVNKISWFPEYQWHQFFQNFAEEVDAEEKGRSWLDVDVVGRALFERLLMSVSDVQASVLFKENSGKTASSVVTRKETVTYLTECYFRLRHEQRKESRTENSVVAGEDFDSIKKEILQNLSTAFAEPELYNGNWHIKNSNVGPIEYSLASKGTVSLYGLHPVGLVWIQLFC